MDPPDRQSDQAHLLVILMAGVLVEEETVLAVSRFLVKKGTIPHESATLDEEEEKAVLSSNVLVLLGPFLLA